MGLVQLVGAGFALLAFALLKLGHVKQDSYAYDVLNIVAAVLLVTAAISVTAWGFIVLNVVWGGVALATTIKRIGRDIAPVKENHNV